MPRQSYAIPSDSYRLHRPKDSEFTLAYAPAKAVNQTKFHVNKEDIQKLVDAQALPWIEA